MELQKKKKASNQLQKSLELARSSLKTQSLTQVLEK
jgi:hypothetical protein